MNSKKKPMIYSFSYQPFFDYLKEHNITLYMLEYKYGVDRWLIRKLQHNQNINLETLLSIMYIFQIQDFNQVVKII